MNTTNYSQLGTRGRQPKWSQIFWFIAILLLFALLSSCGSSRKVVSDVHSVRYDSTAVVAAKRDTAHVVQSWRDTTVISSFVIDSIFLHSNAEDTEIIHETEISMMDDAGNPIIKKERSTFRKKKHGSVSGHISSSHFSMKQQQSGAMEQGQGSIMNYSDVGTHWADSIRHSSDMQRDEAKVGFFDRFFLWLFGGLKWIVLLVVLIVVGYFAWRYFKKKSIPFKWW